MMDSSQLGIILFSYIYSLDNPDTDIESTYTYLCDRLNIPIQFRLSRDLFVNHNVEYKSLFLLLGSSTCFLFTSINCFICSL